MKMTAFKRAVAIIGSPSRMAAALDVSQQVVTNWAARGVPVERCLEIEIATGGLVKCEDLRPDKRAFFEGLRGTKPAEAA